MDQLITHLIALNEAFEQESIPFILGGGMGIYVRSVYGNKNNYARYPFQTEARATADLDIFLNAETIISSELIEKVKAILAKLNYLVLPEAKYFQFGKEITIGGSPRLIRVDFLSAPPKIADKHKTKVSKPRIKPKGVNQFHAYQTNEAEGLSINIEKIEVNGKTIHILSPYNYLILKLHAFNDRKNEDSEKSDKGRHHAWDIFATIVQMTELDWTNSIQHIKFHNSKFYLQNAKQIQKQNFESKDSVGFLRMREYPAYQRASEFYEPHIEKVVEDLSELFNF